MLIQRTVTINPGIWSCGILLDAFVAGQLPFWALHSALATSQILFDELTFPMNVTTDFSDVVTKILNIESITWITLSEIAHHPRVTPTRSTGSHLCESFSVSQSHFR
jgi:serine/threonine protein kinase